MFRNMSPTSIAYLVVTAGLFGMVVLAFAVASLVEVIVRRKAMRRYYLFGLAFGAVIILFDVAVVIMEPAVLRVIPACIIVPMDILAFGKVFLCSCVGMYCCAALGRPNAPLLLRLYGRIEGRIAPGAGEWLLSTAAVTAWGVGMTWVLFHATSPRLSVFMHNTWGVKGTHGGVLDDTSPAMAVVMLAFAFGEELLFRLGLQNYLALRFRLAGRRYWIAVVITAAVWALGHANVLQPEWVKLVQIFAFGVPLGFLMRRYGVESCIAAHGAFNLLLNFLGRDWITH
jgi:membrane protease YdiL (CAAX protease family)